MRYTLYIYSKYLKFFDYKIFELLFFATNLI